MAATLGKGQGAQPPRHVLRPAYAVARVCNTDALDHRRIAKDRWRPGKVIEESNSGAKKNRRDVDVDFVEEPGVQ